MQNFIIQSGFNHTVKAFFKRYWILPVILLSLACNSAQPDSTESSSLWPKIEPYKTDYLKVSDTHELYYELCGNPDGKTVFTLHGGPGGASSPYMRRFFNPEKFHIIQHDQRGSGKSKPFAEIRENTTQHLIEDIEQLRKHLKLDKIILFGGSWGSTLGLAYAEAYPENVSGLVLRGIFTATKEEIDHFYHGGVSKFFPDTYDKFISALPEPDKHPLPAYLLSLIQSDDPAIRKKYCEVWARYEIKIASLVFPDHEVTKVIKSFDPEAFGVLENYYMANNCFLKEGQLFQEADKIKNIPLIMVNGRYDVICPPITAYQLHKKLSKSELIIAEESGHWMGEKNIETALLQAMRTFE